MTRRSARNPRRFAWLFLPLLLAAFASQPCRAALVLSGTSYSQDFDGIASGLPAGWSVRTGATASSLGTEATLNTAKRTWTDTAGEFKNTASSEGLSSTSTQAQQDNSTDRVLAIRQTGTFGDPGAAFVLSIDSTEGYGAFELSLKVQMLSVQGRSTTWTFDYRIGDSGNFTALGTYADPGVFGSDPVTFYSADLAGWNNQSSAVYFRVVALSASTGSGSRDTFGIDDFSLTYAVVPEPAEWGILSAAGLLGVAGLRSWRLRRPRLP